jgi:hypothetical protein
MKNRFWFLFGLAGLISCQPIIIRGKIINNKSIPIQNATITLKRTGEKVASDKQGKFIFDSSNIHDTLFVEIPACLTIEEPNNERGEITIIADCL